MAENKFNKDTTVKVYALLRDEDGNVLPLATTEHFAVTIKSPYGNTSSNPESKGITGPVVSHGGYSGASQFFFTLTANHLGDYKYKIQYNAFTGPTGPLGNYFKAATVGSFKVVDDDF